MALSVFQISSRHSPLCLRVDNMYSSASLLYSLPLPPGQETRRPRLSYPSPTLNFHYLVSTGLLY